MQHVSREAHVTDGLGGGERKALPDIHLCGRSVSHHVLVTYRARARGARSREVRENHLNGPTTIEAVQQRSNNIITRFVGGVVK